MTTETSGISTKKILFWLGLTLLIGIPTARLLLSEKPEQEAVETAQQVSDPVAQPTDANDFNALIDEGLTYYQQGNYQASLRPWQRALELQPESALALNNIASSLILMGNYDAAIRLLEAAIEREPENQLFKNNLKWAQDEKAKKP